MADETFDAIVVGAGPAGSCTASYLGRAGVKTLLLDKAFFPRDKTCGDALSGKSMVAIRELGLVKELEKMPHARINGVLFSSPAGESFGAPFKADDPNREGGAGYCMRRQHSDFLFFSCAKSTPNVTVRQKVQVNEVLFEDGRAVGVKGLDMAVDGRPAVEFRAKVVVGSDGMNSAVARGVLGADRAALDPKHSCDALRAYYGGIEGLSDKIEIHFLPSCMPGYFWIFPLENGTANVGIGMLSAELNEKMKKKGINLIWIFNQAIANEPLLKERFKNAKALGPITGWRLPFGSTRRQLAGDGWVLTGDAASLVDPFSGEGVGNATLSARLAARVIADALKSGDVSRESLSRYETALWDALGPELATSYQMQRLGKVHWIVNRVMHKANTDPEFADFVSASLSNEEAKKTFASPLFYLKLLLP
ncbi:MAG: geranylgeranyl reductase family protein [Candidatus Micrarchaeota archaeon]